MSYFLKKTKNKKGTYLQIYESYYDPERKGGAHRSYKPLGYVHELIEKGIDDPVAFYSEEVKKLNQARAADKRQAKARQISETSPEKHLGYFPIKNLNDALGVKKYLDLMQTSRDFRFNVADVISALIYSRVVHPCSKCRTYDEVMPKLFERYDFSLDQLYSCLEYIGAEYEKIIEIYDHQVNRKYGYDLSHTYFDCTNFYFEIDREDEFRRKGPSKENRKSPIVGLGLLLDARQVPVGMKLFPGNESEKPIIRDVIDSLKQRRKITGRTIQVADKGLNCTNNIMHALRAGDGYLFSKSVKTLPETEKVWILLDNDYADVKDCKGNLLYRIKDCVDDFSYEYDDPENGKRTVTLREKRVVTYNPKLAEKQLYEINRQVEKARNLKAAQAKKSEFGDSAKYVSFFAADKKGCKTDGKVRLEMNETAIENARKLAGYNLLVTSELAMSSADIYSVYQNLWRIEESFRIMKSQLDARPVYLQKQDTITGHFLICYLSVLLMRIFQIYTLADKYSSEEIFDFFRDFRIVKVSDRKLINLARCSNFIKALASISGLPLTSFFLTLDDIKTVLSHRF